MFTFSEPVLSDFANKDFGSSVLANVESRDTDDSFWPTDVVTTGDKVEARSLTVSASWVISVAKLDMMEAPVGGYVEVTGSIGLGENWFVETGILCGAVVVVLSLDILQELTSDATRLLVFELSDRMSSLASVSCTFCSMSLTSSIISLEVSLLSMTCMSSS